MVEEKQGRIPPQATEVEQSVLGAMLIEREAAEIALELLEPEDFYKPANKQIFEVIGTLVKRNDEADLLSIENELHDKNLLDYVGGSGYLADLTRSVSSAANIDYHAQIISEKSIKRNLILHCNEIIKMAYDPASDTCDLIDDWSRRVAEVDQGIRNTHSHTPSEIFEREENEPIAEKILLGIPRLDEGIYEHTMRRGQVELTIADSGHGKTQFALYKAVNLMKQGYQIGWFQLEDLDVETANYFERRVPDYRDNVFICHDLYDIEDIKREARRLKREHDVAYLVFDYVQNIECNKKNRTDQVEYISQQITRLAKDLKVFCHPLSQITMSYGTRHKWSQEPSYGDVRWSQQLKQDAHIITSVFRPSRIKELITDDGNVLNWEDKKVPYNSVFVKQAKVRYGKQEWKRLHMIHTDCGLELYTPLEDPIMEKARLNGHHTEIPF